LCTFEYSDGAAVTKLFYKPPVYGFEFHLLPVFVGFGSLSSAIYVTGVTYTSQV